LRTKVLSRCWKLRDGNIPSDAKIKELSITTGLSAITLKVCALRGLETTEKILAYLSPSLENLPNPFSINDMSEAVRRIEKVKKSAKEKIRVYGDYDVDGTTSAALLSWGFRELGINFDVRQPNRFTDGYGLNPKAVEEAAQDGISVLLTVDCGISSFEAADKAKELGIDLIVVDHHQVSKEKGLPPAYAIVNPHRDDCESGLKELCGCGLAFYLLMALRAHGRREGWFDSEKYGNTPVPNLKKHLDLVVIATAADQVPLVGANRILVSHGLEVLKNTSKPGVRALMEVAGIAGKSVSPSHLSYSLGPRINASGRMGSATMARDLLSTSDTVHAMNLAKELDKINKERGQLQDKIWDEVRDQIKTDLSQGKFRNAIVVGNVNWHEGVIGIVASKVTEVFHKPAIVISLAEDSGELGKGSVRSIGGKDVLEGLRACAHLLKNFGGHKFAAGLSIETGKLGEFAEAFDLALAEPTLSDSEEKEDDEPYPLTIDGACSIEDLDPKTLRELEKIAPFGPGNPEPVFSVRASVKDYRVLKGRHLKLNLGSSEIELASNNEPSAIGAIWFGGAEYEEVSAKLTEPFVAEWAGVPELNRFRGNVTPSFRVRDWRPE
jgi:single-stranded-DNA-specific exonuclease